MSKGFKHISSEGLPLPCEMALAISHDTVYTYEHPVKQSMQYLRLTPQNAAHQQVLAWQINSHGLGQQSQQSDGFGNVLTTLMVNEAHEQLHIQVQGSVLINTSTQCIVDNRLPKAMFTAHTALTTSNERMRAFTAQHLTGHSRTHLIDFAGALLHAMPYTPGTTKSHTNAAEAFDLGRGVCQDHTHVFLACVRLLRLPARYVSGYLYMEQQGHFASHAWAEVFLGDGWYCFDISNQIFTPRQHVQLAIGRDYLDAAPARGVREGGGAEMLKVSVQVTQA